MPRRPRRLLTLTLALPLLWLVAAAPAEASLYLRLEGINQGPIQGGVTVQGFEDTIELQTFSQYTSYGIDPQTGRPDGRRIVGPLEFVKVLDRSSIPLVRALIENEEFSTFVIDATYIQQQQGEVPYLTITLFRARFLGENFSAAEGQLPSEYYRVAFERIRWEDRITGEVYEDNMGTTFVEPGPGTLARLDSSPNPSPGPTNFHFRLPAAAHVTLDVFDARGRRVARVFDAEPAREEATVSWDGRDDEGLPVASGLYVVQMTAGEWITTQKLAVLR